MTFVVEGKEDVHLVPYFAHPDGHPYEIQRTACALWNRPRSVARTREGTTDDVTCGRCRETAAFRVPSMNEEDVSDKPRYVRKYEPRKMAEVDAAYRRALRSLQPVDAFVGQAVSLLEAQGELDNTFVVFWTDNGTHLGYHRLPYGKRTPYEEDIRFPLIIRGPGVAPGESGALVGNHDLAPTLAELAGAVAPASVDGTSFVPLLSGGGDWRKAIYLQGGGAGSQLTVPRWRGVRTERYVYAEYETGERELYDLVADPYQLENLAGQMPGLEAELAACMDALDGCMAEACRTEENK